MRVLIVDDHDLFRTGLRTLLEEEGFEVSDAASGASALSACPSFEPGVVLMDMNMPGMSGVEAVRRLMHDRPGSTVLMLTVIEDDAEVLSAVRAGALGYLLKDALLPDIVAAIRAAAAGHPTLAPRVAGALVESVRRAAAPKQQLPALSWREQQVLALLVHGCDNVEIGRRLEISPSTVKQHISRLLQKLGAENRVQAAGAAIRLGLLEQTAASGA